jgi:hypothetical protein
LMVAHFEWPLMRILVLPEWGVPKGHTSVRPDRSV